MLKSASFLLKGKKSIIDGRYYCVPFCGRMAQYYKEKLWLLSLLDNDTVSLPLGEEFLFPYHGLIVKG